MCGLNTQEVQRLRCAGLVNKLSTRLGRYIRLQQRIRAFGTDPSRRLNNVGRPCSRDLSKASSVCSCSYGSAGTQLSVETGANREVGASNMPFTTSARQVAFGDCLVWHSGLAVPNDCRSSAGTEDLTIWQAKSGLHASGCIGLGPS